jgi:hypothetical protein
MTPCSLEPSLQKLAPRRPWSRPQSFNLSLARHNDALQGDGRNDFLQMEVDVDFKEAPLTRPQTCSVGREHTFFVLAVVVETEAVVAVRSNVRAEAPVGPSSFHLASVCQK